MTEFILIHERDNVITALTLLEPHQVFRLNKDGETREITLKDRIPFGHKCAIADIRKGEQVIKYGEFIGVAIKGISAGEHVHIHNLKSIRGTVGKR